MTCMGSFFFFCVPFCFFLEVFLFSLYYLILSLFYFVSNRKMSWFCCVLLCTILIGVKDFFLSWVAGICFVLHRFNCGWRDKKKSFYFFLYKQPLKVNRFVLCCDVFAAYVLKQFVLSSGLISKDTVISHCLIAAFCYFNDA